MTSTNGVDADESPTIGALGAALAKAQGQMKGAAKSHTNPHFKSKYADLASIWDACREPLSTNGLAVIQRVSSSDHGVVLTTMLVHSSGEWIRDRCTFPVAQQTAQGYGSTITYARRYALAAMVGVAPDEDDDGNTASTLPTGVATAALKSRILSQAPQQSARRMLVTDVPGPYERIKALGEKYGKTGKELSSHVKGCVGAKTAEALTDADVAAVEASFIALLPRTPPEVGVFDEPPPDVKLTTLTETSTGQKVSPS